MASAGKATVTAEEETQLFTGACAAFYVGVPATSANGVLVRIPKLHKSTDWFPIPVGGGMVFRVAFRGIQAVYAKGDEGSALVNYGVVAIHPTVKTAG